MFYVTAFGFVWAASLFAAELLYETANHWQLRGWWVWRHAPRWTTESAPSLLCKDRGEPWGCERLQKGWVFRCGKAQLHSWTMPQRNQNMVDVTRYAVSKCLKPGFGWYIAHSIRIFPKLRWPSKQGMLGGCGVEGNVSFWDAKVTDGHPKMGCCTP